MAFPTNQYAETREFCDWLTANHRAQLATLVAISMQFARPDIASAPTSVAGRFSREERDSAVHHLRCLLEGVAVNDTEDLSSVEGGWRFRITLPAWATARGLKISVDHLGGLEQAMNWFHEWERRVDMLKVAELLIVEEFSDFVDLD
ncbi:MAG: hypothetical protein CMJ48_10940 [Planctomycetaceae bacterium]|nr:hypothetical protein [Planctomycetaceae bacterium]